MSAHRPSPAAPPTAANPSAAGAAGSASPAAGRLELYLRLGRVSNLPTVWSNCLAGLLLAGAAPSPGPLVLLMGALTLFYTGGMFLNDAFDEAFDRVHRPERPIPAGLLQASEVYGLGFLQLVLGGLALALPAWAAGEAPRPAALLGGGLLAAWIVTYDWRHKRDPLSPLVMALTRGLVYFIAAAGARWPLPGALWGGIAVLLGYLIGLTYAAKQEHLASVRNGWPLACLAAPFVYTLPLLAAGVVPLLLYAGFAAWVLYALSFLLRTQGRSIPRAVVSLIAGISLLDALLIAQAQPGTPWVWAAVAAFALTLFGQRYIAGT